MTSAPTFAFIFLITLALQLTKTCAEYDVLIFINEKLTEGLNEEPVLGKDYKKPSRHVPVGRKICNESDLKSSLYDLVVVA